MPLFALPYRLLPCPLVAMCFHIVSYVEWSCGFRQNTGRHYVCFTPKWSSVNDHAHLCPSSTVASLLAGSATGTRPDGMTATTHAQGRECDFTMTVADCEATLTASMQRHRRASPHHRQVPCPVCAVRRSESRPAPWSAEGCGRKGS